MKELLFALSEMEQHFKREYQNGGEALLRNPMSYSQYQMVSEEKRKYYARTEVYHEDITMNTPGNTIKDVQENGDHIRVVLHSRYSYPVMHNHAYIELIYVFSGQCTHFVEEQSFVMNEGDMCVMAPDAMHAIAARNDDAVIINIMMSKKLFDLSFLGLLKGGQTISEFLEHILYNKQVSPYLIFPTGDDEWMHQTVLNVYREYKEKDYLYEDSVSLYLKQIFIHLIRQYEMMAIVASPINNSQEKNIVALMGYITVNYNHVTLKQAAHFFGYNETYLGQIIQKYTNKNFSTLVNDLQMMNAKRLLEESSLSITDISYEIGCYDASHFTRKFKKTYGETPNAYRRKNNTRYR